MLNFSQCIQEEIERVLGDRETLNFQDYRSLRYLTLCVCESLRLFPHPPVLLRRAIRPDALPGGYQVWDEGLYLSSTQFHTFLPSTQSSIVILERESHIHAI